MNTAFDEAVATIENHEGLASLRQVRANVLSEASEVTNRLGERDGWRNPSSAEAEAKRILKAVGDYNATVMKAGLGLALKGGAHPVARKALDNLRIGYPAFNPASLYRTIGKAVDERAKDRREKAKLAECFRRLKLITSRLQGSGSIFKLYNDGRQDLAQLNLSAPAIDEEAMSARFVINTEAVDREGEMILPSGVRFDRYRLAPIVLWEHGLDPNFPTPIGKCSHPDGSLALERTDNSIIGTCYFARGDRDSERIWNLVKQGVVRSASIHIINDGPAELRYIDGEPVSVYTRSEMLEWSIGRIGVNPEAVLANLRNKSLQAAQERASSNQERGREWIDKEQEWLEKAMGVSFADLKAEVKAMDDAWAKEIADAEAAERS